VEDNELGDGGETKISNVRAHIDGDIVVVTSVNGNPHYDDDS